MLAAAAFAFLFSRYSRSKIGGMTGDVIGACIELSEVLLFALLLAAEKIPALSGVMP
ncbi:MAG: adenosylcobinamide-GDP ribazoletransferase [Spirochaetota bacterium]